MKHYYLVSLLVTLTHFTVPNTMTRTKAYPIESIFIERWSPRAMSGEPITDTELMTLFEAARWAPSSYNNQPWRFIYAKRDTPEWDTLFNLMVPFNQSWAKDASVLVVIVSSNILGFNGKSSITHSFDTGAAALNLALQGYLNGFVVHGMEGFDYDKAKEVLNVPDGYTVEAMFAIGKPGNKKDLPDELQEREEPSDRKPLDEIVFKGTFKQGS